MKNLTLLFLFFGLLVSCENSGCPHLKTINVNSDLLDANKDYCKFVESALNDSEYDFIRLVKLNIEADEIFYHGEVLLQIIGIKGEDYIINIIESFDKGESFRLKMYLILALSRTDM